MANPTISVIIPAFNGAKTIVAALDSVSSQGVPGLEIIVVDDGSPDETVEVVEKWRGECLCKVLRLRSNLGPAGARNAGIKEAKGEWIAFLDADDRWLPGKLGLQLEIAENHSEVAMWCGGVAGGQMQAAGQKELRFRMVSLTELSVHNPVTTSTVLLRREAFWNAGGFNEVFRGPEDYDLWMRVAAKYPVAVIDAPLAVYSTARDSLSMRYESFLPQVLTVLQKAHLHGGALAGEGNLRKAKAYQKLGAAWSARCAGKHGAALGIFCSSVIGWPWAFGYGIDRPWMRLRLLKSIFSRREREHH